LYVVYLPWLKIWANFYIYCAVFGIGVVLNVHLIAAHSYSFDVSATTMTVSISIILIVQLSLIPKIFLFCAMKGLTSTMVQIFFALRIRTLTNNWYYVTFVIAAAVSSGGNVWCYDFCLILDWETTVCSILVAYLGKFNPHFVDFRNFNLKVVFWLLLLSVVRWCSFFCTFCWQIVVILSFASEMVANVMITSILVLFL
jgi:hypothetical protein